MLWGGPEQSLIDSQLNSNWNLKETAQGQPKADSNRLFDWILIEHLRKLLWDSPEQILIGFQLNSNWKLKQTARANPEQVLIEFQLNSNRKLTETAVRHPTPDSNRFSIKFELKLKGHCSEATQTRF